MEVEIRIVGCCGIYLVPGISGGEIILLHHIKMLDCFYCGMLQYSAVLTCCPYSIFVQ